MNVEEKKLRNEYMKRWYYAHKNKILAYHKKRYHEVLKNNPEYKTKRHLAAKADWKKYGNQQKWRKLLNAPDNLEVDHINHDRHDNRLENLRLVTRQQNVFNRRLNKNNTSGYKGVYRVKNSKRWYAHIMLDYKFISLGGYVTKEDAALAYNLAAKKYFGEYAYLNPIGRSTL